MIKEFNEATKITTIQTLIILENIPSLKKM